MLDILVLLLHYFISWQHDEMLLVDECIEQIDKGPRIVQICSKEFTREILLNVYQVQLSLINQLKRQIKLVKD